ncbi:uncharacterized protein LOC144475018 [Augochlora pura]
MVTISQRRWQPRWRMLFAVVVFSSFVRHCELTSAKRLTDTGSSSPAATLSRSSGETRSQNLGSPNDLAWQAWLLLDSQTGAHSGMDSATFLRRITPKSVFIAPALPALPPCADGYEADTMGRCVKNVNIDQQAHFVFLLQQLNSRYGNRGGSSADSFSNNQKKSNGPLQLNIPLLPSSNSQSSKQESEEAKDSIKIPVVIPPRVDVQSDEEKRPSKPITRLQETKNNIKPKDDESVFLHTDSDDSTEKSREEAPSSKFDAVVPVAEFPVDDGNDTDLSEVVDYKIPSDLKTLLNISSLKTINITDGQGVWKNASQLLNSTEATPMLILLPSTVTSPNLVLPNTEDLTLDSKASHHQTHVRESNVTGNVTDKEIIGVIVPESTLPSRELDVPPAVVDRIEANKTEDGNSSDIRNSHVHGSQETEQFYDDEEASEDYADSTNLPDEESSETEGGEILKHGEAGMAILLKGIKRLQNEQRQQAEAASEAKIGETSTGDLSSDAWTIHSNESTTTDKEERDEAGSNVSSEVSINGDMIVETTLLDVTTDKTRNITRTLDTNSTGSVEDSDEYLRELFESEKEMNSEPSVQSVHDQKEQPVPDKPAEDPKSDELEAAPSSSESLLYDPNFREHYAEGDPITEIHTIDEQSADDKEAAYLKKSKAPSSFQNFEPETNFRPTLENRHPTYPKQPVKFPSEEVNSIHSQDYKERVPYPLDDGLHSSTKSSVFAHQKPFHRGLSAWRTASRQQQQQQVSSQQAGTARRQWQQRQQPISISFWTAMPLMRDPSLYSTDQDSHSKTTNGQTYANNRFPEVSPS